MFYCQSLSDALIHGIGQTLSNCAIRQVFPPHWAWIRSDSRERAISADQQILKVRFRPPVRVRLTFRVETWVSRYRLKLAERQAFPRCAPGMAGWARIASRIFIPCVPRPDFVASTLIQMNFLLVRRPTVKCFKCTVEFDLENDEMEFVKDVMKVGVLGLVCFGGIGCDNASDAVKKTKEVAIKAEEVAEKAVEKVEHLTGEALTKAKEEWANFSNGQLVEIEQKIKDVSAEKLEEAKALYEKAKQKAVELKDAAPEKFAELKKEASDLLEEVKEKVGLKK